jgi:hypothetical protein
LVHEELQVHDGRNVIASVAEDEHFVEPGKTYQGKGSSKQTLPGGELQYSFSVLFPRQNEHYVETTGGVFLSKSKNTPSVVNTATKIYVDLTPQPDGSWMYAWKWTYGGTYPVDNVREVITLSDPKSGARARVYDIVKEKVHEVHSGASYDGRGVGRNPLPAGKQVAWQFDIHATLERRVDCIGSHQGTFVCPVQPAQPVLPLTDQQLRDAEDWNRKHIPNVVKFDRATGGRFAKKNGELDAEGVARWQAERQVHGLKVTGKADDDTVQAAMGGKPAGPPPPPTPPSPPRQVVSEIVNTAQDRWQIYRERAPADTAADYANALPEISAALDAEVWKPARDAFTEVGHLAQRVGAEWHFQVQAIWKSSGSYIDDLRFYLVRATLLGDLNADISVRFKDPINVGINYPVAELWFEMTFLIREGNKLRHQAIWVGKVSGNGTATVRKESWKDIA